MASGRASVDKREISKHVFGNSYMLEVCAAMHGIRSRTTLTELVGESGISPSLYAGPVHRLLDVGLLEMAPRSNDDRRERWFRKTQSGLWRVAAELST